MADRARLAPYGLKDGQVFGYLILAPTNPVNPVTKSMVVDSWL